MSEAPLIYFVYGAPDSGRREVIFDLIEGGVPKEQQVLYFKADSEATSAHDEPIEALENVSVVDWQLKTAKSLMDVFSAAPEKIIFLAPSLSDPADCAEAVKEWSEHNNCQIARLITVVNCSLLKETPKAQAWFDACIHFSDIVLLNRRESVDSKWVKEFESGYKKACSPARFLLVKKGRIANPPEVLDPEARRLSLYFDELLPLEEDEFDDEHKPEDTKPDKYVERLESGQRAKPIPSIQSLL